MRRLHSCGQRSAGTAASERLTGRRWFSTHELPSLRRGLRSHGHRPARGEDARRRGRVSGLAMASEPSGDSETRGVVMLATANADPGGVHPWSSFVATALGAGMCTRRRPHPAHPRVAVRPSADSATSDATLPWLMGRWCGPTAVRSRHERPDEVALGQIDEDGGDAGLRAGVRAPGPGDVVH